MGKRVDTMDSEKAKSKDDNLSHKLYPSLPPLEISFYTLTFISGVSLSIYSLYMTSMGEAKKLSILEKVRPWWSSTPQLMDTSDHEWHTWKTAYRKVGAFVVIYPFLSQMCRRFSPQFSLAFCAIYSIVVTMYLIGMLPTLYLFLQILFIWAAYHTDSARQVWLVAILYILCQSMAPFTTITDFMFPDKASKMFQGYLTSILMGFINARCVSFALDRILYKEKRETLITSLLMVTAFCFYLPLSMMGPLVSSKTFKDSFEKPAQPLNSGLFVTILVQSLRYAVWFFVTEASMFFFYQQALILHPAIVNSLDLWALCGMGYFLAQFFYLKYVIMYGWSSFLSSLDNVTGPPHPACVGRIHLYSDMWRYFDAGLHQFMRQYIYLPMLSTLPSTLMGRLCASAVCFSFVYVWHGTQDLVLLWSCLNFIGVTCEGLARAVGRHPAYSQWESCYLGPLLARRMHALLASPLLLMSTLTNLYFLTGMQVGNIFVRRVLLESWPRGFPTIIFFLYCGSQASIEVKNYQIKRQIMSCKKHS